ncbi:response regulator transcription factor [Streptomyces sp. KR80]|uniref:response regulator transcription factor n=1 Tax=Streptomyces sp. KR80 TaxID=3457426 RepID=UPI003FD32CF3
MPDETSYSSGQQSLPYSSGQQSLPSPHASQHTSAPHAVPLRSEHTPAQVPVPQPLPPAAAFPDPVPPSTAPLRVVIADDNPVVRAGLTVLLDGRDDIQVVAEAADGRQAVQAAQQHRPDVVLLDVRMPGVDGISALPYLVPVAPVMMLTYSRESEIVHEALRLGAGGYLVHGEFTADQLVSAVRDIKEGRAHLTTTAANALLAHMRGGPGPTGAQPLQPLPEGLGYGTGIPSAGGHHVPTHPSEVPANPREPGAIAHGIPPQPSQSWGVDTGIHGESGASSSLHPQQDTSHLQPDMAQSSSVGQRGGSAPRTQQGSSRDEFGLSSREEEVMELISSGMSNQQIAAACFISEKTVKNHINRIFAKLHSGSRSEAIAVWLGTVRGTGHNGGGTGRGTAGHG